MPALSSTSCIEFHPKGKREKHHAQNEPTECRLLRAKEMHIAHFVCVCLLLDVLSSIWMLLTIMCMPHWHTNRIRVWIKYPLTYFWWVLKHLSYTACTHLVYCAHILAHSVFQISLSFSVWDALLIHYVTDYNSLWCSSFCGTFNPPSFIFPKRETNHFERRILTHKYACIWFGM